MFGRYEGARTGLLPFAVILLGPIGSGSANALERRVFPALRNPQLGPQKMTISKIWLHGLEHLPHELLAHLRQTGRLATRVFGHALGPQAALAARFFLGFSDT